MKRSPLKRKTPLRVNRSKLETKRSLQRTAISSFGSTTKHARRPRAREFMGWTARQPCMVARFFDVLHRSAGNRRMILEAHLTCEGPIQCDHAGNRFTDGNGKRAHDRTCIPMCRKHHEQRTNAGGTKNQAGIFFGFGAEQVRIWSNEAIKIHHNCARLAGVEIPNC